MDSSYQQSIGVARRTPTLANAPARRGSPPQMLNAERSEAVPTDDEVANHDERNHEHGRDGRRDPVLLGDEPEGERHNQNEDS